MTGYQEIITDPSYAGQIISFTFFRILVMSAQMTKTMKSQTKKTSTNKNAVTQGIIIREDITQPANYRAVAHLDSWLKTRGLIGLAGVDTRASPAIFVKMACLTPPLPMPPRCRF